MLDIDFFNQIIYQINAALVKIRNFLTLSKNLIIPHNILTINILVYIAFLNV